MAPRRRLFPARGIGHVTPGGKDHQTLYRDMTLVSGARRFTCPRKE